MKPLIGIPLRYEKDENNKSIIYIYETLRRSVQKLDADVMPIAPVIDVDSMDTSIEDFPDINNDNIESLNRFLEMCDGLILPGGTKFLSTDMYILDYAIKNEIPVLGICLSMQMMSCYKENEILVEIKDKKHVQNNEQIFKHKVNIIKNSLLYRILNKEEIDVNSFHNYHVTPNHIYKSIAFSEDGIIEALEFPSKSFNMGVQWHPERLIEVDENSYELMKYFINEAIKYKNKRK